MPKVLFIRHGQSEANAGLRSENAATIPLTVLGREQARAIASSFAAAPTHIAFSPYTRAIQTAEPTRLRFHEVASQRWAIQEFTYLSAERCRNTTSAERVPMVQAYWSRADPDAIDGPGVESFRAFIVRVDEALTRARALEGTVALFTHGQFMQAAMWRMGMGPQPARIERMAEFREFMVATPVPNAAILEVELDAQGARIQPLSTAHLGDVTLTF